MNYKEAGVDVDAGDRFVEIIKPMAKTTTKAGVMGGIGGFGALFDLKAAGFSDPILVSTTDGVGTKLKLAIELDNHTTIGIDLVAMCVNDLLVQGATPLFFLDYFATGKLDLTVGREIMQGIVKGCQIAECALVGGETAEMSSVYHADDYDLAGFAVGAVERNELLPKEIIEGDVLIGIPSSGFHSNGFALLRKVVHTSRYSWNYDINENSTLGEMCLTPTRIYLQEARVLKPYLRALAHITGGGLHANVARVIPNGLTAVIDKPWIFPEPFTFLQQLGNITKSEMLKTFNCGVGMVAIVDRANVDICLNLVRDAFVIGQVERS